MSANSKLTKKQADEKQVDKMECWQTARWWNNVQVDNIVGWQNGKLTKCKLMKWRNDNWQNGKVKLWWNDNFMKCHNNEKIDKALKYWNIKLMKWHIGEMASRWNSEAPQFLSAELNVDHIWKKMEQIYKQKVQLWWVGNIKLIFEYFQTKI
jgi:hypothetical protein